MIIRLKEIPPEGREYSYDREGGELDDAINDLVSHYPYNVEMSIKPIGNAYEMKGFVKSSVDEVCSECGYDFTMPLERKFHEILMEVEEVPRKAHSVHGNQSVDFLEETISMTPVKGDIFEPGEFVHESIAIAEPFYPVCGPDGKCLRADEVSEIRKRLEAETLAFEESIKGHPAFTVLKGLELEKT